MRKIQSFMDRLAKIGVNVSIFSNYPWVYLDTVNGKKVEGKYLAEHGFTIFFVGGKLGEDVIINDIRTIFAKIRETLNKPQ